MALQRHWCVKNGKNSEKKSSKRLWPWKCLFRGQILVSSTNAVSFNLISEGYTKYCCINSHRASKYVRKPSQNSVYTRNEIWPWIGDFQDQGCLREFSYYFFHIQRVKLHRNTLSNLHDKWDKFFTLHFTLPAGLVDISTSIQIGDSTWDIQWFFVCILHFIRGRFVLKFPRS